MSLDSLITDRHGTIFGIRWRNYKTTKVSRPMDPVMSPKRKLTDLTNMSSRHKLLAASQSSGHAEQRKPSAVKKPEASHAPGVKTHFAERLNLGNYITSRLGYTVKANGWYTDSEWLWKDAS